MDGGGGTSQELNIKIFTRDKEGPYIMTKNTNQFRIYRNYKQKWISKIYKAQIDKIQKNRQFYNTWRSQYPTFSNVRKTRENDDRTRFKLYYNPSRPTRCTRRTSSIIAIFSKGHTDHTNSHKTSLKKFQTTEIIQSLSLTAMEWNEESVTEEKWKISQTCEN